MQHHDTLQIYCRLTRLHKLKLGWTSWPNKITVIGLKTIRLSNENSNAVGTRFEHVLVNIGQPNLVSSCLRIFPRRELQKIHKNSILPPSKYKKNLKFHHFWRFFRCLLASHFNRHRAISDAKAGNQTKCYDSGNILRPSWLKSVDFKYFL